MVGIVIVSHSKKVAEGTREIAVQMADCSELQIIACGGNKVGGIGTDPDEITTAINKVYSEDGVLVIVDLGSAVMSVEMILENLITEKAQNIKIADAPLLEGTVMAAIDASIGAELESVLASAEETRNMRKIDKGD